MAFKNDFVANDSTSYFYKEVEVRVILKMEEMKREAILKGREIDWVKFKQYCYEYFPLPYVTIDKCFEFVKND